MSQRQGEALVQILIVLVLIGALLFVDLPILVKVGLFVVIGFAVRMYFK
jgi:competence protein ComGC